MDFLKNGLIFDFILFTATVVVVQLLFIKPLNSALNTSLNSPAPIFTPEKLKLKCNKL